MGASVKFALKGRVEMKRRVACLVISDSRCWWHSFFVVMVPLLINRIQFVAVTLASHEVFISVTGGSSRRVVRSHMILTKFMFVLIPDPYDMAVSEPRSSSALAQAVAGKRKKLW